MSAESSLLKPRPQGLSQRDAKDELDSLYAMLEQPRNQSEKKLVTFEGIGPTDDHTGVPIATRVVSIHAVAQLSTDLRRWLQQLLLLLFITIIY